jgi:predicted GNAT family acetyltransferase
MTAIQTPSNPPIIYVEQITNKKELKKVSKALNTWVETSAAKQILVDKSKNIHYDKKIKQLAHDLVTMTTMVKGSLNKKLLKDRKVKVFAAYDDQNHRLQGVAIASIPKGKKGCNTLDELVTNPENVPVLGYEQGLRGTGTALVKKVAEEVLARGKGCKKLHLTHTYSAEEFYKKLGFEDDPKNDEGGFFMKPSKMKALLAR